MRLRHAKTAGSALQKLLLMMVVARRRATVLLWAVLSGKTILLKLRSLVVVLLPSLLPAVGKLLETFQDTFVWTDRLCRLVRNLVCANFLHSKRRAA
jgi:hypothetical protein